MLAFRALHSIKPFMLHTWFEGPSCIMAPKSNDSVFFKGKAGTSEDHGGDSLCAEHAKEV